MVASEVNETNSLGGNKSVTMNATFSSTNNALSPILDTHRTSMYLISNKINEPSETNMNVSGLDDNVILSALSGVTVSGNQITTSTRNAQFKTVIALVLNILFVFTNRIFPSANSTVRTISNA